MRTVFASLPFYDSLDKQDVTRINAIIPVHCPRTQLPSFEICMGAGNVATVAVSTVTSVKLVSCDDTETEIISYFTAIPKVYHPTADDFNTYIKYNGDVLKILLPLGNYYVKITNNDSVFYSDWIRISNIYTNLAVGWLNSGYKTFTTSGVNITSAIVTAAVKQVADLHLQGSSGEFNITCAGVTKACVWFGVSLTTTAAHFATLYIADYSAVGIDLTSASAHIIFTAHVAGVGFTASRSNRDGSLWGEFDAGDQVANYAGGTGVGYILTAFVVKKGESIIVTGNATVNSGQNPSVVLAADQTLGTLYSNIVAITTGMNTATLIATKTGTVYLCIYNTSATNYSFLNIFARQLYSANFINIAFNNSDNFGDLLYEDSFTQSVWLKAKLNTPTHEMVNVGEEKDGVFIAEKIVSKLIYSIITYVSRGMYQCLMRLPQHDTITITDEVGNTYTPAIGNVTVEPAEWVSYETCKVKITFNDGANSSFGWTQ